MRETKKNKHMYQYSEVRNQHRRQGMRLAKQSTRCEEGCGHKDQPFREHGHHSHWPTGLMQHHRHHGHKPMGLMQHYRHHGHSSKEQMGHQRFYGQAMQLHPQHRHRDGSRSAQSLRREIRALEQMTFRMLRRLNALDHRLRGDTAR